MNNEKLLVLKRSGGFYSKRKNTEKGFQGVCDMSKGPGQQRKLEHKEEEGE